MQDVPEYRLKMDKHMINIRRDSRQKVFKQMRQKLIFETEPIQKIAESWKLAPKEQQTYTIVDIQKLCCFELVHVGDLLKKIQNQDWSLQKTEQAIKPHLQFWSYYLQQIYTQNLKVTQETQDFFLHLIDNTTYKQLSLHKLLQNKTLNTLEVGMIQAKHIPALRMKMLDWVTGTQGLTLIYNCLRGQFLSPNQHENVYNIIKQALNLRSFDKLKQCCMLIKQMMQTADFDDTYEVYAKQNGLIGSLLSQLVKHVEDQNISSQANAVIYLMDSYDSLILDYARMGVGLFGVRMITSRREDNMLKGLQIIRYLSQLEEYQAVQFLLEDRELNEAGLWDILFRTQHVFQSRNISIKQQGYNILANIMTNGKYEQLEKLNEKITIYTQKSLFEFIFQALKGQGDSTIIRNLLIMLSTLLYYSLKIQQQNGDNLLLNQIMEVGLDLKLKELLNHDNLDIAQKAQKIMKDIETMQNLRDDGQ